MRARRQLIGVSLAALALLTIAPGVASAADRPFVAPLARPTERARPSDHHPNSNRSAYTVPQAPGSPACTQHFCVHWVAVGLDAPNLTDLNGNGIPDFVERVEAVA